MRILLLGLALMFCCKVSAAGEVVLEASQATQFSDYSGGDHILLKFALPQALTTAKIMRAVVDVELQCEGTRPGMVLHLAPVDWDAGTLDGGWWRETKDRLNTSMVAFCAPADCGSGAAMFEIGGWVRAWSSGMTENFGMILDASAGGAVVLQDSKTVRLTVTYLKSGGITQ